MAVKVTAFGLAEIVGVPELFVVKVAVTFLAVFMVNEHVPAPMQSSPLQPVNVEPESAVAVNITELYALYSKRDAFCSWNCSTFSVDFKFISSSLKIRHFIFFDKYYIIIAQYSHIRLGYQYFSKVILCLYRLLLITL